MIFVMVVGWFVVCIVYLLKFVDCIRGGFDG